MANLKALSRAQRHASPAELEAKYTKRYNNATRVRVLFPEGYVNGNFAPELAAIDHPPIFGVGEIYSIPVELLEKIRADGGAVVNDPESLALNEKLQGKHQLKVRQWREEQAALAKQKKAKEEANAHNASITAEIEELTLFSKQQTGKVKEATWMRINELRKSLK